MIDIGRSKVENGLCLEIFFRDPKSRYLPRAWLQQIPSADERRLLACLAGVATLSDRGGLYAYETLSSPAGSFYGVSIPFRCRVPDALVEYVLPLMGGTGRCRLRPPTAQGEEFVAELLRQPRLPPLDLPEELRYEEIALAPRPRLAVTPASGAWARDRLHGRSSFDYRGEIVASDNADRCVVQAAERRVILRDRAAELAAAERLRQVGWRTPAHAPADERSTLELPASRLAQVVRELTAEGWHVEAHGKLYRSPGRFELGVSSGVDWFELSGTLEFGDAVAHLPELLAAVQRGEGVVRLGDGSFGLLPERWLERYGLLAGLGTAHEDHVRFMRSQVGLLDALLAAQPDVERDAIFSRACEELQGFSGIEPADPPYGFRGELRPYQKDGLG